MRPAQVTAIQARLRGQIDRKSVEDLKDEKARLEWIDYYVSRGMYKQAREMCWEPENEEQAQAEAATRMQAAVRGKSARDVSAPAAAPAPAPAPAPPEGENSLTSSFKNLFGMGN